MVIKEIKQKRKTSSTLKKSHNLSKEEINKISKRIEKLYTPLLIELSKE